MGCSVSCLTTNPSKHIFLDNYVLGNKIGSGAFAQVRVCRHRATGETRVVKIIGKPYSKQDFEIEIALLSEVNNAGGGCQYIVRYFEFFEDVHFFYSVMEYCGGGELFDKIVSCSRCTERQLALWVYQVLQSLQHIHKLGIVHRDVKPQNLLFYDTSLSQIKLIDFGLSFKMTQQELLDEACGTPEFVAPEMILGRYGRKIDVWACGVLFYMLLYGRCPFYGDTEQELFHSIIEQEPVWSDDDIGGHSSWESPALAVFTVASNSFGYSSVPRGPPLGNRGLSMDKDSLGLPPWCPSKGAQSFCASLLRKSVRLRPTAGQAMKDEWLTGALQPGVDDTPVVPLHVRSMARMASLAVKHEDDVDRQSAVAAQLSTIDARLEEVTENFEMGTPTQSAVLRAPKQLNTLKTGGETNPATSVYFGGLESQHTRSHVSTYQGLQREVAAARLRSHGASISET